MTTIYRAGGVKSDTPAGFRVGSSGRAVNVRVILKDNLGVNFQVSPGKTFYIGKIYWEGSNGAYFTLAYDDDGAGANEVVLMTSTRFQFAQSYYAPAQEYDCVIPVPANKYITVRSDNASNAIFLLLIGQEV